MKKLIFLSSLFVFATFISLGQTVRYNELDTASNGEYTSYVSKDGTVYRIGDKITIGFPKTGNTFSFITMGDGIMMAPTPLSSNFSGTETEIKKILSYGNKRIGHQVAFRTKGVTALGQNYTVQFENAISTGEVKTNGMSSDDALAQLKKEKDKLDLGLITQEEYDKKKVELSKYIK